MRLSLGLVLALALAPSSLVAEPIPAAVGSDPPANAKFPPGMTPVAIPSGGVKITGLFLKAEGPAPHPVVVLFHGFPGFEENLDLAQAMRRDGWSVLTLHYRGAWASPGVFSFTHCLEDAKAALAWVRSPDGGVAEGADPGKIVLVGHSMGGWVTAETLAADPSVLGAAVISMANFGQLGALPRPDLVKVMDDNAGFSKGFRVLAGVGAEQLADEAIHNAPKWRSGLDPKAIGKRPLLIVTSDDGLRSHGDALASAVGGAADEDLVQVHLATDHSYSGVRIALAAALLRWLENLPGAPQGL